MTPEELILRAKSRGLKLIALTDHDTTEGIQAAIEEGRKHNIQVWTGVEISADDKHGESVHILGYFNPKIPRDELEKKLTVIREG